MTTCVRLWYGYLLDKFSGFSWESDYVHIQLPEGSWYCQVRLNERICLLISTSTPFNVLFRQHAEMSLPRPHFALYASTGILTSSSIGFAIRLHLRPRLTLNRLALFRNPQSSGERVSHPLYRYLYLHLLFLTLQHALPHAFDADKNAPLPLYINVQSIASVICFMPDYYPRQTARLVSCYALFK